MRLTLTLSLLLLGLGCSGPHSPQIDRIELSRGNVWSGVTATVTKQGFGRYELTSENKEGRSGSFLITPERFGNVLETLEPFRRQAVPYSPKTAVAFLTSPSCPKGHPHASDVGLIWVRWIGPSADQLYFADLGCDPDLNAKRNSTLTRLISSYPIPHD